MTIPNRAPVPPRSELDSESPWTTFSCRVVDSTWLHMSPYASFAPRSIAHPQPKTCSRIHRTPPAHSSLIISEWLAGSWRSAGYFLDIIQPEEAGRNRFSGDSRATPSHLSTSSYPSVQPRQHLVNRDGVLAFRPISHNRIIVTSDNFTTMQRYMTNQH